MSKDKISDYSATANSNTDIGGINIDEGCAPSGINDAIRTLMKQLKDFQQGTNSDPFNGPHNGTVGATTPASGAFTTLSASSTLSVTGAGTIQGLTVGRGAGAVSTNTAVGASALSGGSQTGTEITAVGGNALASNTSGGSNTAVGYYSLPVNTTGGNNAAFGSGALYANTTGSANTAIGRQTLQANTTASNNTAVGYQAGYSNTTGTRNALLGYVAGYSLTGNYCTLIGAGAGYSTTGERNTFVGDYAGNLVTSGTKNTIIGKYDGNQDGLDIRTSSNYIVLSDGDGVPRIWVDGYGNNHFGNPSPNTTPAYNSGGDPAHTLGNMTSYPSTASRFNIQERSSNWITWTDGGGTNFGVVSKNGSGVTYGSNSDYRLKENVKPVANALAKVMALKPVSYDWIIDKSYAEGFLAHELQEVLPFAVKGAKDETYEVGQVLDLDGNVIGEKVAKPEGEMLYGETWVKTGDEPKYQSIDTSHIIATLTAAIQELKAEIDTLKGQA